MKNYVQHGEKVDITAPYAVSSGGGVLVGALFGVAVVDIANGGVGTISTEGVYELAKSTGAGTDGAFGAKAYWDNTAKKVTGAASGNTLVGCFLKAAATGDAVATVRLNGTV
jgi:predicted RecA/RadA family phage recombinase